MPAGSLLALLDDIATVLDDVTVMTKVAAKKTAGVLGDDLALNAQQVAGVRAERELPVVWGVARGSLRNKAILVPAALAISAFAPWGVAPLLVVGGLYLCLEGVEKLARPWLHPPDETDAEQRAAGADVDPAALEASKIGGAIRTDFVLSAEIIVIALGTVADRPFVTRLVVLAGVGLLMTLGVYGLVAAIVKLDDAGAWLLRRGRGGLARAVGRMLLLAAPKLMKLLTVVGTAAMFLVGGGILTHAVPALHHAAERVAATAGGLRWGAALVVDVAAGAVAGAVALAVVHGLGAARRASKRRAA